MTVRTRHLSFILAALLILAPSCSSEPQRQPPPFDIEEQIDAGNADASSQDAGIDPSDAGVTTGLTVEVLGEGVENFDGRAHPYQLLRLTDHDTGVVTYAQWSEPDGGAADPTAVMVFTIPYGGIDWTEEEVDERWAMKGAGLHLDEDGPEFDSEASSSIAYSIVSPRQGVERGMLFLVNNISTLLVYGRFYAGGDIQNDIDEQVAGLRYLAERNDIDATRIGINGGSWGGFQALYAAANAPESVRPTTGLALYPLSDFTLEWEWSEQVSSLPNPAASARYSAFFEPYRRRIAAATGGAPSDPESDYSGFTHNTLNEGLETRFIIVHDAHDVLVPFTQAQALRDTLGTDARYVWFREPEPVDPATAPLSHGVNADAHLAALFTVIFTELLNELTPESAQFVLTISARTTFVAMLDRFAEQAARGQSLDDLNVLLASLAEPRVQVLELESEQFVPGAEYLAETYNEAFGTNYTPQNVGDALRAP